MIGLTGGIGSGKSSASRIFQQFGAHCIDADNIVHDIYLKDENIKKLLMDKWGSKILKDEFIHRQAVADIVFNNQDDLNWLNSLIHPEVKKLLAEQTVPEKVNIIEVPLLYEAGWEINFDFIIAVWTSTNIQRQRLVKRNWSDKEIKTRKMAQMSQDEKISKADFAIINNSSQQKLYAQCEIIWQHLQQRQQELII